MLNRNYAQEASRFADDEYSCWCAGNVNKRGVAILLCVALKGYHPLTTYQWFEDDILLNNPHPLLYMGRTGKYKCLMQSGQKERMQEFCVFGMSLVHCIH